MTDNNPIIHPKWFAPGQRSATPDCWTLAVAGDHVVAVVAHPDDESFGCGSLLALASAARARVTVICATRGECGERRADPASDGQPIGLVRESELVAAADVLGVDEVVVLDYIDSGFSGPCPIGALVDTSLEDLADEFAARLGALQPTTVVTLDGSDGHRDHAHVRDAGALAVGRLAAPPRLVQSCLAQSLMREWVDVMRARAPGSEYLELDEIGHPDAELIAVDTSSVLAVRERAIACHPSQASPFDDLPDDLRRRFLTVDYVVEADKVSTVTSEVRG